MSELAHEVHAPALHAGVVRKLLLQAQEQGLEDQDVTALVLLLERAAGAGRRRQ